LTKFSGLKIRDVTKSIFVVTEKISIKISLYQRPFLNYWQDRALPHRVITQRPRQKMVCLFPNGYWSRQDASNIG